jgi:hypothetical protein
MTWSRLARGVSFGQIGRFDFGAQQVADLVVKDQRQAGQAQQQHEDGANQAAPFVHPGPGLDAPAVHRVFFMGLSWSSWLPFFWA